MPSKPPWQIWFLGAPSTRVYVRFTDVAIAASAGGIKDIVPAAELPVSDVSSLFSVSACAQAVFNFLHMNHGVSRYKIDPSFLDKYPDLAGPEYDMVAQGLPLRPNMQVILPGPSRLNDVTFQTYQSFLEFHTLAPL